MKILVCISCVPDTTSKINFINNDTEFDVNGVQFVINPNDEFGLTRAMWFKEKNNAIVDVINVGEQTNDSVLRKALAIGADKAVRINRKATDSFQVASYIANYAKENSYDLIIAGRESIDYNGSMVPGMISEILNINFVTNCVGLEIQDGNAKAEREIEGGKETLSCKLPMIIGGQKGLVEESDLKIPNMRGIMQARQKPLESIEPPDLDVKTTTNKFYKPKEKKEIKMLDANDLDNLIDLLHNEAKVL
jgi:electron transfer flavoprotein beta subunit